MKRLIVNADDFGLSPGVNAGIIEAHAHGIVTSASLMVRGAAAREAAELARQHPRLSVGLHVDLCEWEYRDEQWRLRYSVVPVDDAKAVADEVARQLDAFRSLMGCSPTHLDSHQHVHHKEPVRSALLEHARRLGVVLRQCSPQVKFCGDFYGQSHKGRPHPAGVTVESLVAIVLSLPEGVTEVSCHPAAEADMDSCYRDERVIELQSLCDPRARNAGVELCSFRDIRLD